MYNRASSAITRVQRICDTFWITHSGNYQSRSKWWSTSEDSTIVLILRDEWGETSRKGWQLSTRSHLISISRLTSSEVRATRLDSHAAQNKHKCKNSSGLSKLAGQATASQFKIRHYNQSWYDWWYRSISGKSFWSSYIKVILVSSE